MPSTTFGNKTFKQEDTILASNEGIRQRPALGVDAAKVQPDANGNKVLRPGSILYKLANGDGRANVRAKLEAALVASSTTSVQLTTQGVQYTSEMCQFFDDGDVLKVLRPYGTITLVDTWDADDTVLVTIAGQGATYTPGSATLATAATTLAGLINAHPIHSKLVLAIASGAVVYLFSTDLRAHTLTSVATTTGDGAATASGAALQGDISIGTIDVDGVSVSGGIITLAAASAVSLPVGAPIGLSGATPYSLVNSPYNLAEGETDISGIMSGLIYGERTPYWDEDIASELPELKFA